MIRPTNQLFDDLRWDMLMPEPWRANMLEKEPVMALLTMMASTLLRGVAGIPVAKTVVRGCQKKNRKDNCCTKT